MTDNETLGVGFVGGVVVMAVVFLFVPHSKDDKCKDTKHVTPTVKCCHIGKEYDKIAVYSGDRPTGYASSTQEADSIWIARGCADIEKAVLSGEKVCE